MASCPTAPPAIATTSASSPSSSAASARSKPSAGATAGAGGLQQRSVGVADTQHVQSLVRPSAGATPRMGHSAEGLQR